MVLFLDGYDQIKVADGLLPTSSTACKLGFYNAFDLAHAGFEGFTVHQADVQPSSCTEPSKQIDAIQHTGLRFFSKTFHWCDFVGFGGLFERCHRVDPEFFMHEFNPLRAKTRYAEHLD